MGRTKTDFKNLRPNGENHQKDERFAENLKLHDDITEAGWFRAEFKSINKRDAYLIASADIYGMENGKYYGNINGFLPTDYGEDDVTAEFLEVFDNPDRFSDVIGKEAKVYVDFSESKKGLVYLNMCRYAKL